MNPVSQAVAEELRAEAARQFVTGRELARRIGRPVTTTSRWLRGGTAINMDELDEMATALGLDPVEVHRAARLRLGRAGLPRKDSNLQPAGCEPADRFWCDEYDDADEWDGHLADVLPFETLPERIRRTTVRDLDHVARAALG